MFVRDVWRIIGKYLTKQDLLNIQNADKRLSMLLDRVPEVWYDKHLPHYQQHFNERERILSKQWTLGDVKTQITTLLVNDYELTVNGLFNRGVRHIMDGYITITY
jgi:hypothetical protein